MKFVPGRLAGLYLVRLQKIEDGRGFFARSFCADEFRALGLDPAVVQCNLSFNRRRGTLRGMHFQAEPHAEAKLVRCQRGRIYDVAVDLRAGSPTFGQWEAFELGEEGDALFIPAGFAHGFQTLIDDVEVHYQMSSRYEPAAARGVRWNDAALGIRWPLAEVIVSDRDRGYPDLGAQAVR